jgi:hypothetical protein
MPQVALADAVADDFEGGGLDSLSDCIATS